MLILAENAEIMRLFFTPNLVKTSHNYEKKKDNPKH